MRDLACWIAASFVLQAGFAGAQGNEKPNLSFGKIQDLEMDLVTVPDSVGSGGKPMPTGADPRTAPEGRWLRIDVPFATRERVTPECKFRFFLEGYEVEEGSPGAKASEKFVVLTGEVTYRDVPRGDLHYAGIFLPPSSVMRFAGLKSNGENDWSGRKMNLRIEAIDRGVPVEEIFDLQADKEKGFSGRGGKKDPEWHKSPDAREIPGALLPVTETPFWPKDFKRYPQLKKP